MRQLNRGCWLGYDDHTIFLAGDFQEYVGFCLGQLVLFLLQAAWVSGYIQDLEKLARNAVLFRRVFAKNSVSEGARLFLL